MAVDDGYTKALLHMNGADTSTTFTDESGKTWTAGGNAKLTTTAPKFGSASGIFDGTGDYIDTPDDPDFDVAAGDFTIDCWIKRGNTNATLYRLLGQAASNNASSSYSCMMRLDATKYLIAGVGVSTTVYVTNGTTVVNDTNWHHIAMVRYGNTLTAYLDGTAAGTLDMTGKTVNNSSNKWAIGRAGEFENGDFIGQIDEFRFSKGIARWTTNFTPPTSEYAPRIGGKQFQSGGWWF
jgi:hypothetical protein